MEFSTCHARRIVVLPGTAGGRNHVDAAPRAELDHASGDGEDGAIVAGPGPQARFEFQSDLADNNPTRLDGLTAEELYPAPLCV